jgi:hypothetical protein
MSLAQSIDEYYKADPKREERLRQIVNKQAGFSLREIDWYVTNMAARKPQIFRNPKNGKIVDVNSDYKDILRCYHKSSFDSFKRKGDEKELKQRNFFRWALENGIVDHVSEKIDEIKDDMWLTKKRRAVIKDDPVCKKKKCESSVATFVQEQKELQLPKQINIVL